MSDQNVQSNSTTPQSGDQAEIARLDKKISKLQTILLASCGVIILFAASYLFLGKATAVLAFLEPVVQSQGVTGIGIMLFALAGVFAVVAHFTLSELLAKRYSSL